MIDKLDIRRLSPREAATAVIEATRVTEDSPIPLRVQAGALLLDAQVPGWARKVRLRTLNLNDPATCVLGQLYDERVEPWGDFGYQAGRRHFSLVDASPLGFSHPDDWDELGVDDEDWTALTEAWKQAIRARR